MIGVQQKEYTVAFAGNPNCGKTTLFNAYTGARLKVANWPGVSVEKKEGTTKVGQQRLKLVDLPGIYTLTSYTMEEKVSRKYLLEDEVDVIINIVDATSLERNLYLTLQLIELGKPVVVALNMIDLVKRQGTRIQIEKLSRILGVPVVPVSGRKREGLEQLMRIVQMQAEKNSSKQMVAKYAKEMENESRYIREKYEKIEKIIKETVEKKKRESKLTDRIDQVLTHRFFGVPIFLGIMAIVFFLTFAIGDFLKQYFEIFLVCFSRQVFTFLEQIHTNQVLVSMIVDGIIAGVGGILTFLPNIFILFLALAVLEDSGYMSRVAYVMDGIMGKLGLSGRAFIPMLLGFGCSVPAIMATRTLEDMRERRKTILITPFMSCSARLPIYVLFSKMFFKEKAMIVSFSMYVLGMIVAIVAALIMNTLQKEKETHTLLIELPEYKAPNVRTLFIYVWEKIKDYLTKAGTTIFLASMIVWFLLNFGAYGLTNEMSQSFGATIGRILVPVLVPVGLGMWQVVVALISGIAAKEVVISSFCVLYGISNINSHAGMSQLKSAFALQGFTWENALALMTFCLLYIPCAATIGVMKRELKSRKWTLFAIIYQLMIAWLVSFVVYHLVFIL